MNCSTRQALDVWADLEDALAGCHGFGGDTAEIYGYRLRPESPGRGSEVCAEQTAALDREAAADLRSLAALFAERRGCRVVIVRGRNDDGAPIETWDEPISHRVHVRVIPAEVLGG